MSWTSLASVISEQMPQSSHQRPVKLTPVVLEIPTGRGVVPCQITEMALNSHIGTHVDAPRHFIPEGRTVEQLTVEELCGSVVVLDVRQTKNTAIGARAIRNAGVAIRHGDGIFLYTGHSAYWHDPVRYYTDYPYLTRDGTEYLLEAGVRFLGVDSPSPDQRPGCQPDGDLPAHFALLGNDVPIIENLSAALGRFVGNRTSVAMMPLPIMGADGAPVVPLMRPPSIQ